MVDAVTVRVAVGVVEDDRELPSRMEESALVGEDG